MFMLRQKRFQSQALLLLKFIASTSKFSLLLSGVASLTVEADKTNSKPDEFPLSPSNRWRLERELASIEKNFFVRNKS